MDWNSKKVLVTGGASFVGSHLVDELIRRGANKIRVVDNLSSGKLQNIQRYISDGKVFFHGDDLLSPGVAQKMVMDMDVVFHLAADHGGRGYVDLHPAACATNLALDGILIKAAYEEGVEKFVFASSGCVYPNHLQTDPKQVLYLTEDMVGPPYDSDNTYGWAKLMAEVTLRAYYKDYGMKSASCRLFTVYGPRGIENHAIMAMIARAFIKQDPYEVWGTGEQVRNWTYVEDTVRGIILAAEKIDDGSAVNIGTSERITVKDAVREIMNYTEHHAEIRLLPDMPTGPYNRVADNTLAKELLGWEPGSSFVEGLHKTIDWYWNAHSVEKVNQTLELKLTER